MDVPINRDLGALVPVFRARVERVLERMRLRGHKPKVWETLRSFERAEELQRRGSGATKSMHCYKVAVDIICTDRYWDAAPEFWSDFGAAVKAEKCVWGGDFRKGDKPHMQAVAITDQARVRASTPEQIEALVARRLG